jgi:hypothetical protein
MGTHRKQASLAGSLCILVGNRNEGQRVIGSARAQRLTQAIDEMKAAAERAQPRLQNHPELGIEKANAALKH